MSPAVDLSDISPLLSLDREAGVSDIYNRPQTAEGVIPFIRCEISVGNHISMTAAQMHGIEADVVIAALAAEGMGASYIESSLGQYIFSANKNAI